MQAVQNKCKKCAKNVRSWEEEGGGEKEGKGG